ncbi:MAG: endopeptidase La [Tepidiphilus sp.]|nr:endopeptidase La [Tepidiphilus sp.]MDD3433603.1 endopeptidase La [Tepidiphilus sp.]
MTELIEAPGKTLEHLPLLPLRDVVVFPHMVIPLFVGRPKSIKALERAMENGGRLALATQKDAAKDDPGADDIFTLGCIAHVLQMLKLPDGTVKVLIEGRQRARFDRILEEGDTFVALAKPLKTQPGDPRETEALRRSLLSAFEEYVKLNQKLPQELVASLAALEDPEHLTDIIAAHLPLKIDKKQELLEILALVPRMERLLALLEAEIDILEVEKRIRSRVKRQMEKSQREFYLNEQVKAIQKELGEGDEQAELDELEKKIKAAGMPKEVQEKAEAELKKLRMMSPMSAEATVVRNYLDVLVSLPWNKKTRVTLDLTKAQKILDADHYGLEKVKERIVEYLAVQKRVDVVKAPILCLVGPPGVGKTSLGQSMARATGRKFVRMALGGVRDEAEIRGHRRTYIGAMPGRIIQSLIKVGVKNPLFLLDEVDKIGMDFRGDPSSALLEVLDPEQNHAFQDHYVEVDFDLSEVMFVATANTLNIPAPLLDRMEVIRLSGYTEDEKIAIAERYLLPKQMKNNGVKKNELTVTTEAIRDIVRYYTREAGVRSLEREISKICRKVVKGVLLKALKAPVTVDSGDLETYLGVRKYSFGVAEKENQVGQVTGLAWTEVGGELLTVEAAVMPGKGKVITTGKLGEVMQESIQAAITVVRKRARKLGIPEDFYEKNDVHVHLPEGAIPKDGPSAGIAITTALVSALTEIPVRCDVAMTGEITLRGEVLEIGGLKEKLLAAVRGGIRKVLIPEENVKDLAEIPENVKGALEIIPVRWIEQVLELALERKPEPLVPASEPPVATPVVAASTTTGTGVSPAASELPH